MELKEIIEDVQREMEDLKNDDLDLVANDIVEACEKGLKHNLYIHGAGRSGFIGKSFVMRLVQLGLKAYFIGESATPYLSKDDILILISGSGQTNTTLHIIEVAHRIGLRIIMVTVSHENKLPGVDILAAVGGKSKINAKETETLPLASYFEINSLLFLESIIAKLMERNRQLKKNMLEFGKKYKNDEVIVL